MSHKLAILVLGNQKAGKSTTWHELFKEVVKTGKKTRRLYITNSHYVDDVFLVNGSPEESDKDIHDIIRNVNPTIVLCSTQYTEGNSTIDFFVNGGYDVHIVWLNPGYSDSEKYEDNYGLVKKFLSAGVKWSMRSGKIPPGGRVQEIKEVIFGWASFRNLINTAY